MVQQLDASQNVRSSGLYDSWGGRLQGTNPGPYGYDGQWGYYTDDETGLLLLTHRYYDPAEGRFVNRDPIGYAGGETNLYQYVWNIPTHISDSLGLWGIIIGDPNHPVLCFGDCNHPTFDFGYPGWWHDYIHSPWWGCLGKCMARKYGIYGWRWWLGWNILTNCSLNKWHPGGPGGGGTWETEWPGWEGIWNGIKSGFGFGVGERGIIFGLGYFDLSLLRCEYKCASNHVY